jgi:mRNA-degrading endonuclease RelE of RelBE toxin-antitoxin system
MYELIFSKEAARFIESLDKGYKRKIKEILEALRGNPFSYPYKKIRGGTESLQNQSWKVQDTL